MRRLDVDDSEAPMAQAHGGGEVETLAVWPAVGQGTGHASQDGPVDASDISCEDSGDSAHGSFTSAATRYVAFFWDS